MVFAILEINVGAALGIQIDGVTHEGGLYSDVLVKGEALVLGMGGGDWGVDANLLGNKLDTQVLI